MSALWHVADIVRAVGGRCSLSASEQEGVLVSSVSIDSRTIETGGLYVAIQGVRQDGHKFVEAAFDNGAAAALVADDFVSSRSDHVLVRVADTLDGLNELGRAARARGNAGVIAVTGSAGKTGTKEALLKMLAPSGLTHASVKSFNNHWGVPLSLARMSAETQFGVFEVGMNHAGEITPLSDMIAPDVALITTVAPVHIEHFASEEEIADAKAEIFSGLRPDGVAVLPADNRHFERLCLRAGEAGVARVVSFGRAIDADVRLLDGEFGAEGSRVRADILGEEIAFELSMPGEHIVMNLLGALAAVKLVGGDVGKAGAVISDLKAPSGRGMQYELQMVDGSALLIDESYNANPASMKVALEGLAQLQGERHSRRIAVLGDMLELGERSQPYHDELAVLIADLDIDVVFAAGEMMKSMFDRLPPAVQGAYELRSEHLYNTIEKNLRSGDVIMIKGSFGSEMGGIVERLRARFVA